MASMGKSDSSLDYYTVNSRALAARYESADTADLQRQLLETLTAAPGGEILDVGCGSGRDAAFLAGQGFRVTAVDGVPPMVEEARRLHPEMAGAFLCLRIPEGLSDLPVPPGPPPGYAGITAVAVLMHLSTEEIRTSLAAFARLLRPRGRILFSVSTDRDDTDPQGRDAKGRYFNPLPQESWLTLTCRAGFRILSDSQNGDGLGRSGIRWLTVTAEKDISDAD